MQPEQIEPSCAGRPATYVGARAPGPWHEAYLPGIGMAAAEQAKAAGYHFERIGQTKPLLAEFATKTQQLEAVCDVGSPD